MYKIWSLGLLFGRINLGKEKKNYLYCLFGIFKYIDIVYLVKIYIYKIIFERCVKEY